MFQSFYLGLDLVQHCCDIYYNLFFKCETFCVIFSIYYYDCMIRINKTKVPHRRCTVKGTVSPRVRQRANCGDHLSTYIPLPAFP